jgi:hypothetical protein
MRLPHHGHVSPATIHLTPKGLFLVGGGEDLAFNAEIPIQRVQALIKERADNLVETTMLSWRRPSFIDAGKNDSHR